MITADYLKRIAAWSRELHGREIEIARADIEKSYPADEFIFMRGDQFDYFILRLPRRKSEPCPVSPGRMPTSA